MSVILWILFGIGIPVLLLIYVQYLRSQITSTSESRQASVSVSTEEGLLLKWATRRETNSGLIWIILCTAISIASYAVFAVNDYFTTDLSYIAPPIIASLHIIIAGRLVNMFLPVSLDKYFYHLLNTAITETAIFVFIVIAFHQFSQVADTFTHYLGESNPGRLTTCLNIISQIFSTERYLLLFTIAVTLYKSLPFTYYKKHRFRKFQPLALAICTFVTGYSLFRALDPFVFTWEPFAGISWVILSGTMAVTLGILADYSKNIEDAFVSEVSLWFSSSKFRMFLLGTLLCSYIVFLRPFTYNIASWSTSVIEWGLVCILFWRIYSGIQGRITEQYTIRLKYSSWKKHMQQAANRLDTDISYAVDIQNDFVENNLKDPLLVYLVTILHDNEVSVKDISSLLKPLIEYRHIKTPLFSSGHKRQSIKNKNRKMRKKILDFIITSLEERKVSIKKQTS